MKNYSKALKRVAEVLGAAKGRDLEKVLEDLLTPAEIHDVDERVKIFRALMEGKSQRKVAADLGVSVAKVTRGAHALQYGTGGMSSTLQNID